MMNTDEIRELINEMDHSIGGLCFIALFSDHSGFIQENVYGTKLGEFNNYDEMIELINSIIKK